jgi:hypothetical protein
MVERCTLESPNSIQSTLTLSFTLSELSLSGSRHSRCRATRFSDSRVPICRNSDELTALTFQWSRHLVGISDFAGSRILMSNVSGLLVANPITRATCPPLQLLWPHTIYVAVGISRIAISRFPLPNLRLFSHEISIGDFVN